MSKKTLSTLTLVLSAMAANFLAAYEVQQPQTQQQPQYQYQQPQYQYQVPLYNPYSYLPNDDVNPGRTQADEIFKQNQRPPQ